MTYTVINTLSIVALGGVIVLIIMLIVLVYRANHVTNNWVKVTDTISDSMVRLIPAVINVATVGKAIHQVLEIIAESKKSAKK